MVSNSNTYVRSARKPRSLKGRYRRIVMRKGLLEKLKEMFIPGWTRSYMYEVFDDPYGEELDRAWEDFQRRKIV